MLLLVAMIRYTSDERCCEEKGEDILGEEERRKGERQGKGPLLLAIGVLRTKVLQKLDDSQHNLVDSRAERL